MNENAKKAYLSAQGKAAHDALAIQHLLNCIEVFRDSSADSWADVGTLNSINAKLAEVLEEVRRYHDIRMAADLK